VADVMKSELRPVLPRIRMAITCPQLLKPH